MEYRKVGRGGAGNFYSQNDIKEASKHAAEDVEAQKNFAGPQTLERMDTAQSQYAHAGRGGAGNLTDPTSLTAATSETADVTPSLQESAPPAAGYYGRGGAGNYRSGDAEKSADVERNASVAQEKQQDVVRDVERGLQEPEKAHLGSEKLEFDAI